MLYPDSTLNIIHNIGGLQYVRHTKISTFQWGMY